MGNVYNEIKEKKRFDIYHKKHTALKRERRWIDIIETGIDLIQAFSSC